MGVLRKVPDLMIESWQRLYCDVGLISVFKETSEHQQFKETTDDQVAAYLRFNDIQWIGAVSKPRKPKLSELFFGHKVQAKTKRGAGKKRTRSLLVYAVSTEDLSKDVCVITTIENPLVCDSFKVSYHRHDLNLLLNGRDLTVNGGEPSTPPEKILASVFLGYKPTAQNFVFKPIAETPDRPGWWTLEVTANEYSLVYKGKATIYVQFLP